MGANEFMVRAKGKTADEAFREAVYTAQWEHGHGGYTGTIAEKDSFVTLSVPEGQDPIKFANDLLEQDDERIRDKWGPAGCVKFSEGVWLFFGWASS